MGNVDRRRRSLFPFLHFISILISTSFISEYSTATDTLTPFQSIRDGDTIVSSTQSFELGFFTPGNSTNRYLGIWYKNITPTTIVWVANRDNPLTDSTGVLKIGNHGNLVLLNKTETVFWSSISSRTAKNPIALLLESGNLVLREDESSSSNSDTSYLWQSFDYPSDTLLPGMKLRWDSRTGQSRNLTSWKSEEDPSHGDFSYNLEIHGLPQAVLREKGFITKYRTGPWNGIQFGGNNVSPNKYFKPFFISNPEEVYYTFEPFDPTSITRLVMNHSGMLQRFRWSYETNEWALMSTKPRDDCDKYGQCGANGICKINNMPICDCLKGYKPRSPREWDLFNWTNGCIRNFPLNCSKGEGFLKIPRIKLPGLLQFWLNKDMSLEECGVKCLRNCSCVAYANSDININNGGSGCFLFWGDLIDIREFNNERGDQDLYLRVPASELEFSQSSAGSNQMVKVVVPVVAVMLLLGSTTCFGVWKKFKKKRGSHIHNHNKDNIDDAKDDLDLPLFDLITIEAATDNFSAANKIGEGGFGPVYKGQLSTGQEIAVKRLSKSSKQGLKEFKNEVILIAKLQHRNLVKLLGCVQRDEMMLVYEYMPNKSLSSLIFDQIGSTSISWEKRFNIVLGIARGLLYLHRDSRLRIIHRDLKASNILLDNEMNAKISDFGIARTFGGDQMEAKTRRVIGTYGYMPPEYVIDGLFSMKSDVFSFGVLVLEIVSGKKNRGFHHPDHDLSLLGHAWNLWNEGKALDLIDTMMEKDTYPVYEVLRCIQVGLLCVQQRREDRPMMSLVLLMLNTENMVLPQPKLPGFYAERYPIEMDSPVNKKESYSANAITITLPQGR